MKLPRSNAGGYFEMRLESIGGMGANLLGKMLGELGAMYLGLNSASFSSYGSEKRGSPVQAFVRWSADEIRENSPVTHPHILGIFHERMGKSVTAGVTEETCVVVNTTRSPEEIAQALELPDCTVLCVDAQKIAMECKSRVNMVMLGAIVRACGFIPFDAAERLVRETVGKKYPALSEANLAGLCRGYNEYTIRSVKTGFAQTPYAREERKWGYSTAPLGGANPCIGNSVQNDLSASREGYLPLFFPEKCIHCGLCDSTCPDLVFCFTADEEGKMRNRGLDYRHCKGCLRCVEICPTQALERGLEREHPTPKHWVENRDLIANIQAFRVRGADAAVTSESNSDGGVL